MQTIRSTAKKSVLVIDGNNMCAGGNGRGFTLVELILIVAIASILMATGIPSYKSLLQNSRMIATTNEFVSTINTARGEAIKRGTAVTLCSSNDAISCALSNDWAGGWIVFTDASGEAGRLDESDTLLRAYTRLAGNSTFSASGANFVRYLDIGVLSGPGVKFDLQPANCSGDGSRQISINRQGHVRVRSQSCLAS